MGEVTTPSTPETVGEGSRPAAEVAGRAPFHVAEDTPVRGGEGQRTRRSQVSSGAITRLTMAITLIRMFIEGPDVSLNGSPTVSPTTVA